MPQLSVSNNKTCRHPSISSYFADVFHGRIRKIAVNAGLGCPNRDGTAGRGGCIFCNNEAFVPKYAGCPGKSISRQIEDGVRFFSGKGEVDGYLISLPVIQQYIRRCFPACRAHFSTPCHYGETASPARGHCCGQDILRIPEVNGHRACVGAEAVPNCYFFFMNLISTALTM